MSKWFLNKPEKRNYRRIDCELPVGLSIEGTKIDVTATNISCGGLFLPIKKDTIRERTDVEVVISLPDSQKQVKVVGEVTRYQDSSFLQQRPEGVALRFNGLYDDNILAIDSYIKKQTSHS